MTVVRLRSGRIGAAPAPARAGAGMMRAASVDAAGVSWRVISPAPGVVDTLGRPAAPGSATPDCGSLIVECRLDEGLSAPRGLLRFEVPPGARAGAEPGFDLALMADPALGLGLFLRGGGRAFQAEIGWPGDGLPALLRILFHWDIGAGVWTFAAEDCRANRFAFASGAQAIALPVAALGALCAAGAGMRDRAVAWIGIAEGPVPFGLPCGLGAEALVMTPEGHVAAAQLRAGDRVVTRDHGVRPVRAAGLIECPAYGSQVPLMLRENYLGARRDLRLLPAQRLLVGGAEVEYLFGEDEVLVEAGYFLDDRSVIRGAEGGLARLVYLLLDEPELICANGCWVESVMHGRDAAEPPRLRASGLHRVAGVPVHERAARRVLNGFEARTLAALRRQAGVVV